MEPLSTSKSELPSLPIKPKYKRTRDAPLHAIENVQEASEIKALRATYTPTHQTATKLASLIKLDSRLKALSNDKKQQIVDSCIAAYKECLEVAETALGETASVHPDSRALAQDMANRIAKIAKAYHEIQARDSKGLLKEL